MKWYWWVIIIETSYILITGFIGVFGWIAFAIEEYIEESEWIQKLLKQLKIKK